MYYTTAAQEARTNFDKTTISEDVDKILDNYFSRVANDMNTEGDENIRNSIKQYCKKYERSI